MVKKYPIFISYKRVDKDRVLEIKELIESQTGVKCWIDIDGIESADYFKKVIIDAITECEVMLFMYSKAHEKVKNLEKDWTIKEIDFADGKQKRIVIIHLDETDLEDKTKLVDYLDIDYKRKQRVFAYEEESMQNLIRDLKQWLFVSDKEPEPSAVPNDNASLFSNLWNKTQKVTRDVVDKTQKMTQETVDKSQEACKNFVPDFKEWFFSKDEVLPKSLLIKTDDDNICFVLSEDEKYYMANINQKSDNFAWWNNKTIAVVGASALLVGAPVLVAVGFGIAGLVEFLIPNSLTKLFSKNKKSENASIVKVTKEICAKLSQSTGYIIDLPTLDELRGVAEDAKDSCLVIRVKDNKKLFQKRD